MTALDALVIAGVRAGGIWCGQQRCTHCEADLRAALVGAGVDQLLDDLTRLRATLTALLATFTDERGGYRRTSWWGIEQLDELATMVKGAA